MDVVTTFCNIIVVGLWFFCNPRFGARKLCNVESSIDA
jgi:hypothetical protein